MNLVGITKLLVLLQFITERCLAGKPEIQLTSKKLTVEEGGSFSVLCIGDVEVEWKISPRYDACYSRKGTTNIKERVNVTNGTNPNNNRPYFSVLNLINVSYLDVGFFNCGLAHSLERIVDDDQFYLFVNSSNHLLLPCMPHSTRHCDTTMSSFSNHNPFAPCIPTLESMTMEVTKNEQKGFMLPEKYFHREDKFEVVCTAISKENSTNKESCSMDLQYFETRQNCDVELAASINTNEIFVDSDVALRCTAACEVRQANANFTILHEGRPLKFNLEPRNCGTSFCLEAEVSLANVSLQDGGLYSCQLAMTNYKSSIINLSMPVQVPMAPVFLNPNAQVEFVKNAADSNETVDCMAVGTPAPTYIWTTHGRLSTGITGGNWTGDWTGELSCNASNSLGSITRTFLRREPSSNQTALIVGCVAAGFACIVGVLLFGMFRLRRNNRRAKLSALFTQYFSEENSANSSSMVSESPIYGSRNIQHVRMASINSAISSNSTTLTELGSEYSQASTSETHTSTSWLMDSLGQLPYKNSLFEIDPKLLTVHVSQHLGSGFFGVVVKGELIKKSANESSVAEKIPVAVKCIKSSFDIQQYDSLTREIKLLSILGRHLNVVNLEGAVTRRLPDGELYMILEFCGGGDLEHFLLDHKERFRQTVDHDFFTRQRYLGDFTSVDSAFYDRQSPSSVPSSDSADVAVNSTYLMVPDTDPQNVLLRPLLSNEHENGTRFTEFHREFLTIRDLVIFAYQVASGMEFLHVRKCLHRDLAARNVLVSSGNVLKITDFGLAKDLVKYDGIYKKKTSRPMPCKWLAPECLRFNEFKPESDIWSYGLQRLLLELFCLKPFARNLLGVLLWEIFTLGQIPYPSISNHYIVEYLLEGNRLEMPKYVPGDICAIANACWDTLPSFRPNFSTLKAELARNLPDEVVRYYKEKSSSSTRRNLLLVRGGSHLPALAEEQTLAQYDN